MGYSVCCVVFAVVNVVGVNLYEHDGMLAVVVVTVDVVVNGFVVGIAGIVGE